MLNTFNANMTDRQQFCLRCDNHQSSIMKVFGDLLSRESLIDVTLACGDKLLKAHKVVLAACSELFEEIFLNNPCQHPVIVLKDIKSWEMEALLAFMYKGEINVFQESLSGLMRIAETLKVRGLTNNNDCNEISPNSNNNVNFGSVPEDASAIVTCLKPAVGHSKKKQKRLDSRLDVPSEENSLCNLTDNSFISSCVAVKKEPEEPLSDSAFDELESANKSFQPVEPSKTINPLLNHNKFEYVTFFTNAQQNPDKDPSSFIVKAPVKPLLNISCDYSRKSQTNSGNYSKPFSNQIEALNIPKDSGIDLEANYPSSSRTSAKNTSGSILRAKLREKTVLKATSHPQLQKRLSKPSSLRWKSHVCPICQIPLGRNMVRKHVIENHST